jgi:predicted DsbA family dithiol-disulfide isomerase
MKKVEFFYSPVCPYCPHARELLKKYRKEHPDFEYTEVNTFTEEGIKRGMSLQVMAVPSLVVQNEIKISGWPFSEEDIDEALK